MRAGNGRNRKFKDDSMKVLRISSMVLILLTVSFSKRIAAADSRKALEKLLYQGKDEIKTDAFIVFKDEKILFESYGRGFGPNTKHLSWSIAKTIGGILIGQAIEEGYLSESDRITKWMPEFKSDATVRDLLQMSSGIRFREEYSGIPVNSDATLMLYLKGPKVGFAEYVSALPKIENIQPGHYFYYSSGDSNVLMAVLRKAINDDTIYNRFPWKRLFNPLGIHSATFEQDSTGTFVGSSYVYLTPHDYVKVGQLLMNRGMVQGKQLIPDWYFKQMTEVAEGVQKNALTGTDPVRAYSNQVTTNHAIKGQNGVSQYPHLPEDALLMIGHQGQLVVASPSQKLVIVRLAMDKKNILDRQELFKLVSSLLEEGGQKISTARDHQIEKSQAQSSTKKSESTPKTKIGEYFKIPRLVRSLAAKEFCSCRFVEKRTSKQCKDDLRTMLPILPRLRMTDGGVVISKLGTGIKKAKARFISDELGCTLMVTR